MEHISVLEARDRLAEILNRVAFAGEQFVLERRGKPVAALISMDDLAMLQRAAAEVEDKIDADAVRAARRQRSKAVPLSQVKRELSMSERRIKTPRRRKSA